MNKKRSNYILRVVMSLSVLFFLITCNSIDKKVEKGIISFIVPHKWKMTQTLENQIRLSKDSINIIITWGNDMHYDNSHMLSQLEYIRYTDPNILTNFFFNKPGVVYTTAENIKAIKTLGDSLPVMTKENPKPILETILKVPDTQLHNRNIDYLVEFQIDSAKMWVPIKLPEYFNQLKFFVDSSKNRYYKLYYPTTDIPRRAGVLVKNVNCKSFISAKTTLFDIHSKDYDDIIRILKSIQLSEHCSNR